jgi:membrane associated rhomboid family serine protease
MDQPPPGDPIPGRPDASPGPERSSGLSIEHCYRHPNETTGVHCTRCGRPICPDCMQPAPVGYQCPECVAEARRATPRMRVRFLVGRPGALTTAIIALNVAMFVLEVATGGSRSFVLGGNDQKLVDLGAQYPPAIALGHQYWRLITAMFLHAGLLHIALNMYALYLFGYLIEGAFGKARFLAIYFVAGFMASVTSFVFSSPFAPAVGASGAVFGLLGAWVAYNYRRRNYRINRAQLQWAYMLIALNLILGFSLAGIDNFAHVGGLLSGAVAGAFAEGVGPAQLRPVVRWAGLVALVAVGIAMTAFRVATFPLMK